MRFQMIHRTNNRCWTERYPCSRYLNLQGDFKKTKTLLFEPFFPEENIYFLNSVDPRLYCMFFPV